jgi:acylphosphatase
VADQDARVTALVRGRVQGVGFRWWVRDSAVGLGLAGWARNLDSGGVEVVAEGAAAACESLVAALRSGAGPGRVTDVTAQWHATRGDLAGFDVR